MSFRPSALIPLSNYLRVLFPVLVLSLSAVACSSTPNSDFERSSDGGPVPHEVLFTPADEAGGVSYLWDFGDGQTSTESSPAHMYQDAGTFTVRLTASKGDSQSFTEQKITLAPGEAGWITVEPKALMLESGERSRLRAEAFDALGNPVRDAVLEWKSSSEEIGTVLEDGTFIAGPKTGNYPEAVTVRYERLGVTATATVPVEVVYGELETISVEPDEINLRVNNRVNLKVIARDRQGHVLPEPELDWNPVRVGVDAVMVGGEFRAGQLPTSGVQELVNLRVSSGRSTLTHTISGTITPGILDRITVTSSAPQVAVGDTIKLTASGFDRFGNSLTLDSVDWELLSETYGEITADGVFTPSGDAVSVNGPVLTVVGELDRVQSFSEVQLDILPGIAAGIVLTPVVDSIPVGAGNPYLARVVDDFGNVIDGVPVIWTTSAGGTITADGVFIAGFETGEFPGAITATVPAGASGNPSPLTASADIVIRDRSSNMIAVEVSNATDSGIILIDLATADVISLSEELDNDGGLEISPSWWPDGKRLAYASDVSGTLQVYDIEIETGIVRQLVDDPDGTAMPAISPDGGRIAFVITTGSKWQLFVADLPEPDEEGRIMPITREHATKLSVNDDVQALLPWWSPDGSTIAFTTSRSPSDVDISVVAADGTSPPVQIGDVGLSAFGWSDDGKFILAVDNQSGGAQSLLVLDVQTGDLSGLVPLPFQAFLAAWGPDSTEVAVVDRLSGSLWLLDADGSSIRQALGANFVPRRVAWSPVAIDAAAVLARQQATEPEAQEPPAA